VDVELDQHRRRTQGRNGGRDHHKRAKRGHTHIL